MPTSRDLALRPLRSSSMSGSDSASLGGDQAAEYGRSSDTFFGKLRQRAADRLRRTNIFVSVYTSNGSPDPYCDPDTVRLAITFQPIREHRDSRMATLWLRDAAYSRFRDLPPQTYHDVIAGITEVLASLRDKEIWGEILWDDCQSLPTVQTLKEMIETTWCVQIKEDGSVHKSASEVDYFWLQTEKEQDEAEAKKSRGI